MGTRKLKRKDCNPCRPILVLLGVTVEDLSMTSKSDNSIEIALAQLFPKCCEIGAVIPQMDLEYNHEDISYIINAPEKRRIEFLAGRLAARMAMEKLGVGRSAIPVGEAREPIWPTGLVGSISHCSCHAVAVVSKVTEVSGLGVDIERCGEIREGDWKYIFTRTEIDFLRRLSTEEQCIFATVLFSAKEAYFKMQFPVTRSWIDFTGVTIASNERFGVLSIRAESSQADPHQLLALSSTTFARCGEYVLVGCYYRRS
jgi:4'-phosphopantetheinyl transferase EntD